MAHRALLSAIMTLMAVLSGIGCGGGVKSPPSNGAPRHPTADYEPAACPFTLAPDQVEGDTVNCGYVTVPERRALPHGKKLRIAVAVFEGQGKPRAADPVMMLLGGPGIYAEYVTPKLTVDKVGELAGRRDLVIFDQRGVGASEPSLDCPEVDSDPDGLVKCRDRLVGDGVQLEAYSTPENAADVEAVAVALGYDEVNLVGTSYGSRLALAVLRDHPQKIRSVVLDSVLPPQKNLYEEAIPAADLSLRRVFQECAASPACAAAYPDVAATFSAAVAKLDATPIIVEFTLPSSMTTSIKVDGTTFVYLLVNFLQDPAQVAAVPAMLTQLMSGASDALLSQALASSPIITFNGFSEGTHFSILCREDLGAADGAAIQASAAGALVELGANYAPVLLASLPVCDLWDSGQADVSEREPVQSSVPVLLLSGAYDPVTPPSFGADAQETLSSSFHVTFPGGAHDLLNSLPCAAQVARTFVEAPNTQPDTSCTAASKIDFLDTTM